MPSAQPQSRNHCGQSDRPRKLGKKMQQQCERGPEKVHHGKSLFLSWTESGENDASKFSDSGESTKNTNFALVDDQVQFDLKAIFQ